MHSYEFIIQGETTGFRCLNEKYIWIDKEDMVHVLSAHGYWHFESNRVVLKNNPFNQPIYLEDYIMNSFDKHIKHINGNPLDFRKNNLLISSHEYTPFFIRPLSKRNSQIENSFLNENISQKIFSIKKQQTQIGFVCFLPVTEKHYKMFLQNDISRKELLENSPMYENETSYYHIAFGNFPEEEILFNYLTDFYKKSLFSLQLRSIKIMELTMCSDNSSYSWGEQFKSDSSFWNVFGDKTQNFLQIKLNSFYH